MPLTALQVSSQMGLARPVCQQRQGSDCRDARPRRRVSARHTCTRRRSGRQRSGRRPELRSRYRRVFKQLEVRVGLGVFVSVRRTKEGRSERLHVRRRTKAPDNHRLPCSRRYEERNSDTLWSDPRDSQRPRTAVALIGMLFLEGFFPVGGHVALAALKACFFK